MGWRRLGLKCLPARHVQWPAPSSFEKGQTLSSPDPRCSVASSPPEVPQHYPDVGVVAILLGEAVLGGRLRCRQNHGLVPTPPPPPPGLVKQHL